MCPWFDQLFEEYGMPSSHSQFMFFVSVYMTLFVAFRLKHNSAIFRVPWCLFCLVLAFLVAYGRIYLHYHTWAQVIVGSTIGTITGLLWFLIVHCVLTPCFPKMAAWQISEIFLIRDLTPIPNVIWFEYTQTMLEARQRSRKMSIKNKQN